MFASERQEMILRQVQEQGSVRLAVLARQFNVSMVTLRRDVSGLADQGLVTRVHGGITQVTPENDLPGSRAAKDDQQVVLGMLVPSTTYYYPAIIKGVREVTERVGARVALAVSRYDGEVDRARVRQLVGAGVDGLLLTPSRHPETADEKWLGTLPVPAVLVERQIPLGTDLTRLDTISSHHTHGAFIGTRHLAELGHRTLALATRTSPNTASVHRGFMAAVSQLGLDEPMRIGIDADGPNDEQIERIVHAIREGVTGLLVHNDDDALMLVQHLREAGLRVPDDVSLVAYDDEVAALSDPPLTTIAPMKESVGRRAATLLLGRLDADDDTPVEHTVLLPELKVRGSSAPPIRS